MTFLESMKSVVESDAQLQELVEEVEQAASLVLLILLALQLGRAIAVKMVEEILNERGQAPEAECAQCEKCQAKLESKGLLPREILTLIGRIKWKRRVRRCPNGCEGSQVAPSDEVLGVEAYHSPFPTQNSLETQALELSLPIIPHSTELDVIAGVPATQPLVELQSNVAFSASSGYFSLPLAVPLD